MNGLPASSSTFWCRLWTLHYNEEGVQKPQSQDEKRESQKKVKRRETHFSLSKLHHLAFAIPKDLDLDVSGPANVLFEKDSGVGEESLQASRASGRE